MPRIFKTYSEPTDLYIIGVLTDEDHPIADGFGIDDDETGFCISNGLEQYGLLSLGWGYILTKEQMLQRVDTLKDATFYEWGDEVGMFLPSFKGNIGIMALDRIDGKEVDLMTDDIDLQDYITHQLSGNVAIVLPNGTNMAGPLSLKEIESQLTTKEQEEEKEQEE